MRMLITALLLAALTGAARADDPTLAEMEAQASKLYRQDIATLPSIGQAAVLYVSPDGKPDNAGTMEAPLDLATALSKESPAKLPGTLVWLMGGTYRGPFEKAATPCGAPGKPIVFRAMPGQRVTLTAGVESGTVLTVRGDHVWFWGMELTTDQDVPKVRGDTVKVSGGNGLKLINLVIHETPNRSGIGGWQVGNDQEFYGCVVYRVGFKSNTYAHGTYTQNTKTFTVKRITDCLFFDTYGFGVHCYGQDPVLGNYQFDGVGAWGNGLPPGSEKPAVNFLVGGYKDQDNMVLRNCFTYYPAEGKLKRGADVGYVAKDNGEMRIDDCTFVGGIPALHVVNWRNPTFRRNRIASPHGLIHLVKGADAPTDAYLWDDNEYYSMGVEKPFSTNTDGLKWRADATSRPLSAEEWKAAYKIDAQSRFLDKPEGLWVICRPNRYEPDRATVAVYNWTGKAVVGLDLSDLLTPGQTFRLLRPDDLWGEPVTAGKYDGKPVDVAMTGAWAPQFACFVLVRDMR